MSGNGDGRTRLGTIKESDHDSSSAVRATLAGTFEFCNDSIKRGILKISL